MNVFRFLCPSCSRLRKSDRKAICGECLAEDERCRLLYRKIVQDRPYLGGLTMPAVFEAMYAKLKELERLEAKMRTVGAVR